MCTLGCEADLLDVQACREADSGWWCLRRTVVFVSLLVLVVWNVWPPAQ